MTSRRLMSTLLFVDGSLLYGAFGIYISTRDRNRFHRPFGVLLAVFFVLTIAGAAAWDDG